MWWQYTLIILGVLVMLIFANIGIGLLWAFYFRKCPICGKRMVHEDTVYKEDGNVDHYVFSCHHCGDIEDVIPEEIIKETV